MTQFQFKLNYEEMERTILESNMSGVIKSSIILMLNEYMEYERDKYMQNEAYERNEDRKTYRNGYYERDYMISLGKITLKVPRTRNSEFSTTVFERYQRMDQALILSMMEMVINGVSTRKITKVIEQLAGETVSASFVSSLTKRLDPLIKEWANRNLSNVNPSYLYVDAMYIKVRENGRVISKAVYIAEALKENGYYEIVGFEVEAVESFTAWQRFLQSLKNRGLKQPKLIISDAHEGLKKAIKEVFTGATWQRCTVHLKRNIFDRLPKKNSGAFKRKIIDIFNQTSEEIAREKWEELIDQYHELPAFTKALEILEYAFDDAVQFMHEQEVRHKYIKSTNHLERLNQEIRRRERVIRIFPNHDSSFRLIGAVLMDLQENPPTRKRKVPMND